jgi:hypothetical protein
LRESELGQMKLGSVRTGVMIQTDWQDNGWEGVFWVYGATEDCGMVMLGAIDLGILDWQ